MSERLADLRCSLVEPRHVELLAAVTQLTERTVARRIEREHGNVLVVNAFANEWPEEPEQLAVLNVATARRADLVQELVAGTGLTRRTVRRRLEQEHGRTLLVNAFPELVSEDEDEDQDDAPASSSGEDLDDEATADDYIPEPIETARIGTTRAAVVRDAPSFIAWLAPLLGIDVGHAKRELQRAHGLASVRSVFADHWPPTEPLKLSRSAVRDLRAGRLARASRLVYAIAEMAGITPAVLKRRVARAAPETPVPELLEWSTEPGPTRSEPPPSSRPAAIVLDGGYRLGRKLGAGSFGRVYEAEFIHPPHSRVVIKIGTGLASDTDVGSLQKELGVAFGLTHQNICAYKGIGRDRKHGLYLVLAPGGRSLDKVIDQEGVLKLDRALAITAQAAAGLDYAHSKGVIHHDVKPANLLVDESDGQLEVRVTDFGISVVGRVGMNTAGKHTVFGTRPLGLTPAYAAPEQLRHEKSKKASDQYALALVFCSMLEGEVFSERYRRRDFGRLTRSQNHALARALAEEPTERFESCTAFARALAQR